MIFFTFLKLIILKKIIFLVYKKNIFNFTELMGCLPNKTLILRNIKKQKESEYEKEDFRENYEMYVENDEKHEEDTEALDYSKIQGVVKPEKKIIIDLNNANKNGKTLNKKKRK